MKNTRTRDARPGRWVAAAAFVFLLQQAAQLAVTPVGEGMDFWGHWAYIHFYHQEGTWPNPGQPSVPGRLLHVQKKLPAPDHSTGEGYARWRQLPEENRAQLRPLLSPSQDDGVYVAPNSQAQHPPLYYGLMSRVYRWMQYRPMDQQQYVIALLSLFFATLSLPAVYGIFRTLFDKNEALLLLLAVAWYPNLMPFLGRVTNDALAFPVLVWTVWACVQKPLKIRHSILAALLLGIGYFTKTYALAIAPASFLCISLSWKKAPPRIRYPQALAFLCTTGVVLAVYFAMNYARTGHLVLLKESVDTAALPMSEKVTSIFSVAPLWFAGGLVKGFFWSGYWSFVSPGAWYYLPLPGVVVAAALRPRCRTPVPGEASFLRRAWVALNDRTCMKALWPHYLWMAFFVLGMVWHAALFGLRAELRGEAIHSGNEGWYMNVLLPSAFLIVFYLVKTRMAQHSFRVLMHLLVPFMIVWNGIARLSQYGFWMGHAGVAGRLRSIDWTSALKGFSDPESLASWFSLPGIMQPIIATSVLPLAVALALSGLSLCLLTRRWHA